MIDLASVDTVLSTTRSVRRKLDFERPVPPDVLLECIDVATQAPTGLIGEGWRFLVVQDAERKREIAAIYRELIAELSEQRGIELKATQMALVDRLASIPAMIFVCCDVPAPRRRPCSPTAVGGAHGGRRPSS